jgi:signal transduction histidine kinase
MRSVYRQVLTPQLGILILAASLAWWLATDLVADALRTRLEQQLVRAVTLFADGRLPPSEGLLRRLGSLLDARFELVSPCVGDAPEGEEGILREGARERLCRALSGGDPLGGHLRVDDGGQLAVLAPIPTERPRADGVRFVLAVTSLAEVRQASRRIAYQLAAAAASGVLILAWVSHLVARGITRPIGELAALASGLARDQDHPRAEVRGPSEIRMLAQTFNLMADRLLRYQAEVAERNRLAALGELSTRLAHEIRNPLTAIKLNVQLLGEGGADAAQTRRVARVADEIRRLELVVESALSLGRATACRLREEDLNPVVEEVTALLAPQLAHRGIGLDCRLGAPPLLRLDADRIKQLLLNLLRNAADALPNGGQVRVGTRATDQGWGELTVEDSGPGIDPALRQSLFRRSVSAKAGGLGVGLLVGAEIVDQHGGRIDVEKSDGLGGARLRVTLPPAGSTEAAQVRSRGQDG